MKTKTLKKCRFSNKKWSYPAFKEYRKDNKEP